MTYTQEVQKLFGARTLERLHEELDTPVIGECDVLVCGGGFAGITAAVSAARCGARVVLLERSGSLGGLASLGMVNYITPYRDWYEQVVGGIGAEIIERLKEMGGLEGEYDVTEEHPWLAERLGWKEDLFGETGGRTRRGVQFDSEQLKILADELTAQSGVEVLYHTQIVGACSEGGRVTLAVAETKSGRAAFRAKVFIDCTGDGDLAARAGAEFFKGREQDGKMLPVTSMIRIRGVDVARAMGYQKERKEQYGYADLLGAAKAGGELDIPHSYILVRPTVYQDGLEVNGTRVAGIDGTDVFDLTKAEVLVRRQAQQLLELFRRRVPGCEGAYLSEIAPLIGVRETRRIVGEYVIGDRDLPAGAKFRDSVGRGTIHVDIHNPSGDGYDIRPVRAGDWYEIPYRSLVARGFSNLLTAGRCISATSVAQSGLRLYLNVFVSGQGAGTAAALLAREGCPAAKLDISLLQSTLVKHGVKLCPDKN